MSLNKEIERKWLVDKDKIPFDFSKCKPLKMVQSYICFSPTVRLRNTNDEEYILCVKTKGKPGLLARDEFETELTKEQYETLLSKIEGNVIEKTRYCIESDDGYTMEFDIFEGALSGLCYMEIEFPDEESALSYPTPPWAIKDVSDDFRYKNAGLAKFGMPE
ncbi:MAG: CYTH domain-containing protein [Clostridia bacterium]|nr:CYTH domain-containing protein [Clostridia bacterium]